VIHCRVEAVPIFESHIKTAKANEINTIILTGKISSTESPANLDISLGDNREQVVDYIVENVGVIECQPLETVQANNLDE
jgi:hypothetical protein